MKIIKLYSKSNDHYKQTLFTQKISQNTNYDPVKYIIKYRQQKNN